MITTLRGGPGPSSWLQLPVSHELESAKLGRKVGLWARAVDMALLNACLGHHVIHTKVL